MLTLPSVLQNTIGLYGAKPAIIDSEYQWSWAEYGTEIEVVFTTIEV